MDQSEEWLGLKFSLSVILTHIHNVWLIVSLRNVWPLRTKLWLSSSLDRMQLHEWQRECTGKSYRHKTDDQVTKLQQKLLQQQQILAFYVKAAVGFVCCCVWSALCVLAGVWAEVVPWSPTLSVRGQRQQAVCVEPHQQWPCADLHRPPGSSQGHRMVTSSAWLAGVRGWHSWPLCPLLEYTDRSAAAVCWHRLTGLQPGLVQTLQWTGKFLRSFCSPHRLSLGKSNRQNKWFSMITW